MIKFLGMVFWVLLPLIAGFIGSIFTMPSIPTWYAALNKPPFNPPNWIFGPVWTTLFLLMGFASYLIWRKGINDQEIRNALIIFIVQLVLNSLWSILFFGLHSPMLAFIEIIILWLAIVMTIMKFYSISTLAGLLLIPYILWVSFASVLNLSIWLMN